MMQGPCVYICWPLKEIFNSQKHSFLPMAALICVCPCRLEKMEAVSETDVQFWMAKAVNWGEATSCSAVLDISRHLGSLRSFLQQVLQGLQQMVWRMSTYSFTLYSCFHNFRIQWTIVDLHNVVVEFALPTEQVWTSWSTSWFNNRLTD